MFKSISKPLMVVGAVCAISGAALIGHPAGATASSTTCVDGSKAHNLSVTWNSASNVTVHTVGNAPLCADTTLFFSSYTMPDNYNGGPFDNNPTATPQTLFDNTSTVLKKGTDGTTNLSIKLPEACKNIQVDVYYAPEITTVTPAGHGAQYITGKMMTKTADSCTPTTPEQPPVVPPTEAQTPPAAEQPKVTVAAPVQSLPQTGNDLFATLATAGLIGTSAFLGINLLKRRG